MLRNQLEDSIFGDGETLPFNLHRTVEKRVWNVTLETDQS
jgi:hypothetical protein